MLSLQYLTSESWLPRNRFQAGGNQEKKYIAAPPRPRKISEQSHPSVLDRSQLACLPACKPVDPFGGRDTRLRPLDETVSSLFLQKSRRPSQPHCEVCPLSGVHCSSCLLSAASNIAFIPSERAKRLSKDSSAESCCTKPAGARQTRAADRKRMSTILACRVPMTDGE